MDRTIKDKKQKHLRGRVVEVIRHSPIHTEIIITYDDEDEQPKQVNNMMNKSGVEIEQMTFTIPDSKE